MNNRERLKQNNSKLKILSSESKKLPNAINTTDADATSEDIIAGKTAYVNDEKITGTLIINNLRFGDYSGSYIQSALLNIDRLDTRGVTDMSQMFDYCTNLTYISAFDTSNVTNMNYMFDGCKNLASIPQLDTSNVTSMLGMFQDCHNLTTIPLLNTNNVTNMNYMFYNCYYLTTIPQLDTSNVTDMYWMFCDCYRLVDLPILDTSSVTDMNRMFSNCNSLSDDSLNNILAMCANATSYTNTKTLKYIGLSQSRATKCQSLSNYQAFLNAGWTTGY